jgi:hypothetical protein
MSVFAIHVGNLHVRSAFHGSPDLPTVAEDSGEPQRFLAPSIVTIDSGGAQFGYSALMCAEAARPDTTVWRYRRAGLAAREVGAVDWNGRGLSAEAFTAYALGKLDSDARIWAPIPPDMALVVPDETTPATRLRLASLAVETTGRPLAIVAESDALMRLVEATGDGDFLVISVDDDATRARLVRQSGGSCTVQAGDVAADLGLEALRLDWLQRWSAEAISSSLSAFGSGDNYEFEGIWQDVWDCLNDDPRAKPKMPTWPLLRRSTLNALTVPRTALLAELSQRWRNTAALAERLLTTAGTPAASLVGLIVVADRALARIVAGGVGSALGIAEGKRLQLSADAYACGGAAQAALAGAGKFEISEAPHGVGVIGMAKDGSGTTVRALIEKGAALPATAAFSVMANRDAQRMLVLTLETVGSDSALSYRFQFGPMLGVGMLRVNMHVQWGRANRIVVTATDSESGLELKCVDAVELVAGKALAGASHLKTLLGS